VSGKEPQPIANNRTAEIGREIPVPGALVRGLTFRRLSRIKCQQYRLAGQRRRLRVVRGVVQQTVASLPGDDVDHRALGPAVLRGRPHGLNLYFLNEVDARLGARDSVARGGKIRAVDEKDVLVGAAAERGHEGVRASLGRWRDPGGGPDQ